MLLHGNMILAANGLLACRTVHSSRWDSFCVRHLACKLREFPCHCIPTLGLTRSEPKTPSVVLDVSQFEFMTCPKPHWRGEQANRLQHDTM